MSLRECSQDVPSKDFSAREATHIGAWGTGRLPVTGTHVVQVGRTHDTSLQRLNTVQCPNKKTMAGQDAEPQQTARAAAPLQQQAPRAGYVTRPSLYTIRKNTHPVGQRDDFSVERHKPRFCVFHLEKWLRALPGTVQTLQLLVHVVQVRRTHDPCTSLLQSAFVTRTTETVGIAKAPFEDVLVDLAPQQELLEEASFGARKLAGQQSPVLLKILLGHQPQDVCRTPSLSPR